MGTGNFLNVLGDARANAGQGVYWREQWKENVGAQGFNSLVRWAVVDIFLDTRREGNLPSRSRGIYPSFSNWPKNLTGKTLKADNDVRRKRLLFRSWHRGTRELDLLLGGFAERYLSTFTTPQLEIYEQLLEFSDPDIYNWITESEPVPTAAQSEVLVLLQNFKTTV